MWPLSRMGVPIECRDIASSRPRIAAYFAARSTVSVAGSPRSARSRRSTLVPSFREASRTLSPIPRRAPPSSSLARCRRSRLRRSPRARSLSRVATCPACRTTVIRGLCGRVASRRPALASRLPHISRRPARVAPARRDDEVGHRAGLWPTAVRAAATRSEASQLRSGIGASRVVQRPSWRSTFARVVRDNRGASSGHARGRADARPPAGGSSPRGAPSTSPCRGRADGRARRTAPRERRRPASCRSGPASCGRPGARWLKNSARVRSPGPERPEDGRVVMIVPGLRMPRMIAQQVIRLDHDADALGRQPVVEEVGDLLGHALLDLEPARVHLDDARDLREADDLAPRDVGDRRRPEERQQVVLAQRVERDVLDDDHLRVLDVEDGAVDRAGRDRRGSRRSARRTSGGRDPAFRRGPGGPGPRRSRRRISRTASSTGPVGVCSDGVPMIGRVRSSSASWPFVPYVSPISVSISATSLRTCGGSLDMARGWYARGRGPTLAPSARSGPGRWPRGARRRRSCRGRRRGSRLPGGSRGAGRAPRRGGPCRGSRRW